MKCPSCKYENRTKSMKTDKVIRYKSGKRKGEIKEVKEEWKTIYEHDPEFIELFFRKEVDDLVYRDDSVSWYSNDLERAELYACPMCGTVIVKDINDERYHE